MLNWLKQKIKGGGPDWRRVQQLPGTTFPFPKSAKLRPEEDVILAVPAALISDTETIGSVLMCDAAAEIALNEELEVWYIKLKRGMTFSLAKSCEVMLIAKDSRPRFFKYLPPQSLGTNKKG